MHSTLTYHQGNLIARLAPIKEDSYEKKLGPGSYDVVRPSQSLAVGVSSFGRSKEKRKPWFEDNIENHLKNEL